MGKVPGGIRRVAALPLASREAERGRRTLAMAL